LTDGSRAQDKSCENGPDTVEIANYTQASCFCTHGVEMLKTCVDCAWESQYDENDNLHPSDCYEGADAYAFDCSSFGYYANSTLSYPSTTRISMPLQTQASASDCSVCGIIEGQIAECGFGVSLATENYRSLSLEVHSSVDQHNYWGTILFNRTAAECFCTLPVLRRLNACWRCVSDDDTQRDIVWDYGYDCHQLGYWSDSQVIQLTETPSSATPTQTSSAFQSATGGIGGSEIPGKLSEARPSHFSESLSMTWAFFVIWMFLV
jgi:hypothetical protein